MNERTTHEEYMQEAIELGKKAPRWPFGALIVDSLTGIVLARGWNRSVENPIWHGEIDALNQLAQSHPGFEGSSLSLYSTAEPCPMCQAAILWAGIGTVIFGTSIRFLQGLGWPQIDILAHEVVQRTPFRQCNLIEGILQFECNTLFEAARRQVQTNGD